MKALDPHGVRIVALATLLFVIGALICWWQLPLLNGIGKGWWLSTAIAGSGIGLLGLVVLTLRRRRLG